MCVFLQVLNSSLNLPIYYYVGSSFKIALKKYFRLENCQRTGTRELENNRLEIPLVNKEKVSHAWINCPFCLENLLILLQTHFQTGSNLIFSSIRRVTLTVVRCPTLEEATVIGWRMKKKTFLQMSRRQW